MKQTHQSTELLFSNKETFENGRLLPVMEHFYTLQGEGMHSGKAAYFIRVGGCDVGCHWCDVKESWNAHLHPLMEMEPLLEQAIQNPSGVVVITGGEPSLYPMDFTTEFLHKKGVAAHLETSGAYPLTGNWDWICLSPKKTINPLPDVYSKAHELKVIVYNRNDLAWAQKQAEAVRAAGNNCPLILQPEWSKREEVMPLITEFTMQHPQWRVGIQTHKYLHLP
jgi:organic radical activating enzyme